MDLKLKNKKVLVTGAGSGIGRASSYVSDSDYCVDGGYGV